MKPRCASTRYERKPSGCSTRSTIRPSRSSSTTARYRYGSSRPSQRCGRAMRSRVIASSVLRAAIAGALAVDIDLRRQRRALEAKEQPLARELRRDHQRSPIPSRPAVVVVAAVLAVEVVPGVRQTNGLPGRVVKLSRTRRRDILADESPVLIEVQLPP